LREKLAGTATESTTLSHPHIASLAFLFVLPLLYSEFVRDASGLPRYALLGMVPPAILLYLTNRRFPRIQVLEVPPVILLLLAILLWAGASTLWSVDIYASLNELIQLSGLLLLMILTLVLLGNRQYLNHLLSVLLVAGTIVAVIGIQQALGQNYFDYQQSAMPAASFLHKNIASMYLDLIIPLYIFPLLYVKNNFVRWLTAISFAVALNFIILTHTRGSWLGLLCAFTILILLFTQQKDLRLRLLKNIKENYLKLIVIILITLLLQTTTNIVPDYSLGRTYDIETDVNMRIRLHSYVNAVDMFIDKPLTGFGLGGFMLAFRDYMSSSAAVPVVSEIRYMVNLHNDPLQLLVELGIPGAILLLFMVIFLFKMTWQVLRSDKTEIKELFLIILAGLVASSVHSFVSFPLHRPASAAVFFVLLAILINLHTKVSGSYNIQIPCKNLRYTFMTGITLMLLLNIGYYSFAFYNNFYLKETEQLAKKALKARSPQEKKKYCAQTLEKAQHIEYAHNYASKILLPYYYSFCERRVEQGLAYTTNVLNYHPSSATARLTRGTIYMRLNEIDLAFKDFNTVITILPQRASGYIGLAKLSEKIGNTQNAIRLYSKAIELDPENISVRKAINRLTVFHNHDK